MAELNRILGNLLQISQKSMHYRQNANFIFLCLMFFGNEWKLNEKKKKTMFVLMQQTNTLKHMLKHFIE